MRSIFKTLSAAHSGAVQTVWMSVFLYLWIISGHSLSALTNDSSELIALGDSLYQYDNYYDAITEYKRFAVFHPDDSQLDYVYSKMGQAYQKLGEWENSLRAFLRSIELSSDRQLVNQNRLAIAVTGIASKDYHLALLELQKVVLLSQEGKLIHNALFFQTITYIYMENWLDARNTFQRFMKDSLGFKTGSTFQEVDSLLAAGSFINLKSPTTAKQLSTILPGSGQVYNHQYKDALNTIALNGVNLGFTYHLLREQAYIDAALFFLYLGIRYYAGNRYHAAKGAADYNSNVIDRYQSLLLKALLELSYEY